MTGQTRAFHFPPAALRLPPSARNSSSRCKTRASAATGICRGPCVKYGNRRPESIRARSKWTRRFKENCHAEGRDFFYQAHRACGAGRRRVVGRCQSCSCCSGRPWQS